MLMRLGKLKKKNIYIYSLMIKSFSLIHWQNVHTMMSDVKKGPEQKRGVKHFTPLNIQYSRVSGSAGAADQMYWLTNHNQCEHLCKSWTFNVTGVCSHYAKEEIHQHQCFPYHYPRRASCSINRTECSADQNSFTHNPRRQLPTLT